MNTVVRVKASPAGIVQPVKQRQWRATGRYTTCSGFQLQGMSKQQRQHVSIECRAESSRSFNGGLPRSPGRNRRLAPAAERSQQDAIVELCNAISSGIVSTDEAAEAIKALATGMQQVEDFAKLDGWRQERTGSPEVVFGAGKTPEQIARALGHLSVNQRVAVATRIEPGQYASVRQLLPGVKYNALGRILTYTDPNGQAPEPRKIPGSVAIVTAGTCDLPVAEECHITCRVLGCYSYKIADVGVAGLHRLLGSLDSIRSASVVIVMAGMDAALPSVLAGLISAPVIAVPTSVGYGASLGGISALLASLNSCAPGVAVVNIDNGFGAAVAASRILQSTEKVNTAAAKQLEALRAQAAVPAPAGALGLRNGDGCGPFMDPARPGPGLLRSNGHNRLSSAEERAGAAVGSSSAGAGSWSQKSSLPKEILHRKAVTDLPDLPAGADALLRQLQRIKARRG